MLKNKIILGIMPALMAGLFLTSTAKAQTAGYPEITEQSCDAEKRCSEGLECFGFPGIGLRCAQQNPCSYFKCPEGTSCFMAESYPAKLQCDCSGPDCPVLSEGETAVSYNLLTRSEVQATDRNNQRVPRQITLWEATAGSKGILETAFASVKTSNELVVEESRLFMKTSAGKEAINVMPEDAVAVSETPDLESVKKIELNEESQKPVYLVKGTRQSKILFLFPVTLEVETKVNAEIGNVVSVKKPWWSFLAR